ncbi:MAG: T9SS type A sorting domain-containing protein, partial [Bacteroidales bacterium]|nr:T9SS type A sorting domain-containing protein [Bacteroidales bacterium]
FDKNGEKFTHVVLFKNGLQEKIWNINTANVNITYNTKTFDNDYFYVKVTQKDGDEAISSPIWIEGGLQLQTLKVRVKKGSDDAEEGPRGKMYINSSDLELVYDITNGGKQKVGIRFEHNKIPQGALITNAYIQFTADEISINSSKMTIKGHKSTNSKTFEKVKYNVSSRIKTNASVTWKPGNWYRVGKTSEYQRTPNMKNIVQEIVNQSNFKSSSALTFIITGKGRRTAESFEGWKERAPQLVVEYLAVKAAGSEMKPVEIISKTGQEINMLEFSNLDFKIAPNPVQNNEIILHLINCEQALQMKLFNTSGHCVMHETVQGDIAVLSHQLTKGLYILQLSDNKTIRRQKLIVE